MKEQIAFCKKIGFSITQKDCEECFQKILAKGGNCDDKYELKFDETEPKLSPETKKIIELIEEEGKNLKKKINPQPKHD